MENMQSEQAFPDHEYSGSTSKYPSLPMAGPKPVLIIPDDDIKKGEPFVCDPDSEIHCLTCSDEAVEVTTVSIDTDNGLALVEVEQQTEEVDITLLECVLPGDTLLVHGGVAIQKLGDR